MRFKLDDRLAEALLIYHWVLQFSAPVLLLCFTFTHSATAQERAGLTPESQWRALKAFYFSTGGDTWKNTLNWDVNRRSLPISDSLDQWYGITMKDGHVSELILPDNGLTGALPDELQYLTHLEVLDLQENSISGSIGPWIQNLSSLVSLRLQQNQLTGSIPQELGGLSQLEYLNLRDNFLEGKIPKSIENLDLLRGIWLHNNRLYGGIPQGITGLPDLEWLWLGGNPGLSGVIPISDSERSNSIDFYLGETNLCLDTDHHIRSSTVYLRYGCFSDLEWRALRTLFDSTQGNDWINNRGWTFDQRPRASEVDQWFGVTVENGRIHTLNLPQNNLNGQIPADLNALRKLHALQLDHNPLRNTIPESISLLNDLKVFSAIGTKLCASDSDSMQAWLQQIPTLLGVTDCDVVQELDALPSALTPPKQFVLLPIWVVAGLILVGIIGASGAIITFFVRMRRFMEPEPKEIDQQPDQLGLIEQRIDYLIETANSIAQLADQSVNQSEANENFSSSIKSLRDALDDREHEIKRFKKGYDNAIYRKFVSRFIRVIQATQYFLQQSDDSNSELESIHSLLEDALLECDVHPFSPEIGSDYRSAFGVADYPKILDTDVEKDDCMIAEILETGFYMKGSQEKEVLIPARVAIFRFDSKK